MLRELVFTSGARIYSVTAAMAVVILTARWLGPEGRGAVVVLTTWVNLFASVGYLSLGQVCLHRATSDRSLMWLGAAVGALLSVTGIVSVIGWIIALGMWHANGSATFGGVGLTAVAIAFAGLPFLVWEQYNSALLTLIGRLKLYNLNQLAGRSLTLALAALILLKWGGGVEGVLFAILAGQVVIALAGAGAILRRIERRARTSLVTIRNLVADGARLHLNAIGVLLFSSADILMLQYFRGPAEAGLFQLASQFFTALLIVPQSALLVLNGKVTTLEPAALWAAHKRMIAQVMVLMILMAVGIGLLAPWFVPLLAGSAFGASADVLQILCLAVIPAMLSVMMGLQWIVRGLFLQASLLTLSMGAANCAMNLFLIPRFGAQGAAWATVVGYFAIPLTANLALAWRIERQFRSAP